MRKFSIETLLLSVFIILSPFYFFRSGIPQIADFVGAAMIGFLLVKDRFSFRLKTGNPLFFLLLFVIWTIIVDLIWAMILGDLSIITFPIYYLYDFFLVYVLYVLYKSGKDISFVIFKSVGYSLIIQTLLSTLVVDFSKFRQTLFFNNPNQLGYFAVCSLTIFLYLSNYHKANKIFLTLATISGVYLVLLSLSNAAMLSTFLLLVIHFFNSIKKGIKYIPLILAFMFLLASVGVNNSTISTIVKNVQIRLMDVTYGSDSNLEMRGYDRIVLHPEYWFFGGGEGNWERFDSVLKGEIHSSWFTIFFSYGVIGVLMFLSFFLNVFKYKKNLFYFIPVFFYGLTHQGLRSTDLWILFLLFVLYSEKRGFNLS